MYAAILIIHTETHDNCSWSITDKLTHWPDVLTPECGAQISACCCTHLPVECLTFYSLTHITLFSQYSSAIVLLSQLWGGVHWPVGCFCFRVRLTHREVQWWTLRNHSCNNSALMTPRRHSENITLLRPGTWAPPASGNRGYKQST